MTLYMVRASLSSRHLHRIAKRRGHGSDLGYSVHSTLSDLFGEAAPKPFVLDCHLGTGSTPGQRVSLFGYASSDQLARNAAEFASPESFDAVDWESFASKPMPTDFSKGRILSFEVRVCPTLRKASAGPNHEKGAEVDAFLSQCWSTDGAVSRGRVYSEWLRARLHGAELHHAELVRFDLTPSFRRGKSHAGRRRGRPRMRPDATLRGKLEVVDPAAFSETLARGIGRHRSFGFGMLLLRR